MQKLLEAQGDVRIELEAGHEEVQRLLCQIAEMEERQLHLPRPQEGARGSHGVTPSASAETQVSMSQDAAEAKASVKGDK